MLTTNSAVHIKQRRVKTLVLRACRPSLSYLASKNVPEKLCVAARLVQHCCGHPPTPPPRPKSSTTSVAIWMLRPLS
jgi:hypothetical protein